MNVGFGAQRTHLSSPVRLVNRAWRSAIRIVVTLIHRPFLGCVCECAVH